jgi:hypothetical protein
LLTALKSMELLIRLMTAYDYSQILIVYMIGVRQMLRSVKLKLFLLQEKRKFKNINTALENSL